MKYIEIKGIASRLRNNPTPEEALLWQAIRKRKVQGFKFLRQHPIIYESNNHEYFFYIPDFYCAEKRTIIEMDGKIHENQKDRDLHRDIILKSKGLKILRLKNEELKDIESILKKITDFLTVT